MAQKKRLFQQLHQAFSKRLTRNKSVLALSVLLILFLTVSAILAMRLVSYWLARNEYAAYQAINANSPPPSFVSSFGEAIPTPYLHSLSSSDQSITAPSATAAVPFYSEEVAQLQRDNSDAVGWLDIIDTTIQYPLVQGTDNEYYMTHTFQKKNNASGAIFVDCWNAADFSDFNTVIYGHNMKDGSMFASLRDYRSQYFFDTHPYIDITLIDKKLRYRVFAAYIAQDENSADFRGQECFTEEEHSEFIKAIRKRSTEIKSSLAVSRYDRLLTLVTCTSGTHPWFWVVHAVLVEEQTLNNPQ